MHVSAVFITLSAMSQVSFSLSKDSLVLHNSLIRREVRLKGFVGTTSLRRLDSGQEFVRTIEPEAVVTVDGKEYWLGGVKSVPNKAYLDPKWIETLQPSEKALTLAYAGLTELKGDISTPKAPKGKAVLMKFDHPDFTADLTLAMYEGVAGVSKWVEIQPKPGKSVEVNQIVVERLSLVEGESEVEKVPNWRLPNVTALSNMSFGGNMRTSIAWKPDPDYSTQVNYLLATPCVLEVRPPNGIHVTTQGEKVRSITSNLLLHNDGDRETTSLEVRKFYRTVAPWVLDNPLMLHVVSDNDREIRTAIDQASECGFEMVIMSFGSGLNMEDVSEGNLKRWKEHRQYANSKGVRFGGYSLLASRRISDEHDVINPLTGKIGGAIFGNSPCLGSKWGIEYFEKIKKFIDETGFQLLEHDGNYPGDQCASELHPGHRGLDDSQWAQFRAISEFYRWCRNRNVYLNVPDYYFLNGSNKTAMGYRETNWSLPREQQHVHARQNMFDGTWSKTPSMGWMFVALVQYHGGGAAATIEPLRDHLLDYELHFANTFGYGVQACWRGTRLYDSPETKAVVLKMVQWYKEHRRVLESDVIHLRRADGRSLDYVLHISESDPYEAMLIIYNPTENALSEEIQLELDRYGFRSLKRKVKVNRAGRVVTEGRAPSKIKVDVKERGWTWIKFSLL
jgi:hypothetical protein